MKVYLSCICKGSVSASTVHAGGRCVGKKVSKILGDTSSKSQYKNLINCYMVGFQLLRSIVESNKEITEVIIETNNSAFKAWVERGFALPQYTETFFDLMELLNDIPVNYEIIYNKELKAKIYAKESYIPKEKLSGIE